MTAGAGRSGGANPVGATAEFLLAHTGDLALTDVREAIAVLTPDQHATAWMMIAGGGPLGGGPGMGFGTGPGQLDAGAPRDRGPISRPPAARDVPRRPDGASSTTP
jgi:hypothetical protein